MDPIQIALLASSLGSYQLDSQVAQKGAGYSEVNGFRYHSADPAVTIQPGNKFRGKAWCAH